MARVVLRRGFTVFDLLVLLGTVFVAGVMILLIAPGMFAPRPGCGRHLKDSTQVRGIHQAMIVWAQNNNDRYPLASAIDADDLTVPEDGPAKDTTANLFSMLVWNGSVGTEMFYSPAEADGRITVHDTYQFESPAAAVKPAKALWDPSFRADFTAEEPAHNSYAHLLPHGERLKKWGNSFNKLDVILGNRGPRVDSVTYDTRGLATAALDERSVTHLIHGSRVKWEGHTAFNDNHVEFLTEPKTGAYAAPAGTPREDVLFHDEPDDAAAANHYLGIFTKAGANRADFNPIWD